MRHTSHYPSPLCGHLAQLLKTNAGHRSNDVPLVHNDALPVGHESIRVGQLVGKRLALHQHHIVFPCQGAPGEHKGSSSKVKHAAWVLTNLGQLCRPVVEEIWGGHYDGRW